MKPEVAKIKTVILPILKQYQAIQAGLFGSVVRGEMKPDSDVDILVELPPNKSLLDFVSLKHELENALGRSVDLIEYSTIHPILKEQILSEEVGLMKRDSRLFVQDILESIIKIEEYTQDLSQNDFFQNTQVQDAVVRRLEIIGEATKNLPRNLRLKYPNIPWQEMAGMRDVLIHTYFGMNLKRVGPRRRHTNENENLSPSPRRWRDSPLPDWERGWGRGPIFRGVWEVIEQDLPNLKRQIKQILDELTTK